MLREIKRQIHKTSGHSESLFSKFPERKLELINDIDKRQEFQKDYERLIKRCGPAAMENVFMLYLVEQDLEQAGKFPPKKMSFTIYENTAEILARFAEKNWAQLYKNDKPTDIFISRESESEMALIDFGVFGTQELRSKRGNPTLKKILEKKADQTKDAIYIHPQEIRKVFAEIDGQFQN